VAPANIAVYYTDGAIRNAKEDQCGMLASAVSYLSGGVRQTETAFLPSYSGHVIDAELYVLKMAFDLAVRHIIDEDRPFANVVFFSDSQDIIQMLVDMQDTRRSLGPIPTEDRWALEDFYDAADKLAAHGNESQGDQAPDPGPLSSRTELPEWVNRVNGDVKDEALWHLSELFFRWGTRRSWIAASFEHKVVEEKDMEEEDRTVYREVMTLKKAQDEDAKELPDEMAERALGRQAVSP
jgi:hypothetical protein